MSEGARLSDDGGEKEKKIFLLNYESWMHLCWLTLW